MISTAFKPATVLTGLVLVSFSALGADSSRPGNAAKHASARPSVTTYATGLTNPRGLAFGPDGNLYVAEAGTGGGQTPAGIDPGCPVNVNIYSPYTAGYSGRVTRVLANGTKQTVAANLPSMTDAYGGSYGPTDVAFIGDRLYVLIEMGGCSHAMPDDLPAILRVNPDGSTTKVANLNAWHVANPPHFLKDTDPATTDQEPGGVFHSMIALGKYLYVVETNRGFLLRVDPSNGSIETLYDMSFDNKEHNPIVMTRRGNDFFVGTFGEDGGPAELAVFDKHFRRLFAAVPVAQPNRRPGVARPPPVRRRDLPLRQSVDDRQRQPRHVRSQDRRAQGGAVRIRQPPERARGRSRRRAVHVELGDFVHGRRRREILRIVP